MQEIKKLVKNDQICQIFVAILTIIQKSKIWAFQDVTQMKYWGTS